MKTYFFAQVSVLVLLALSQPSWAKSPKSEYIKKCLKLVVPSASSLVISCRGQTQKDVNALASINVSSPFTADLGSFRVGTGTNFTSTGKELHSKIGLPLKLFSLFGEKLLVIECWEREDGSVFRPSSQSTWVNIENRFETFSRADVICN